MQGQRSSISALPENISFDHGSTSSDAAIDTQISWSGMQASGPNRLPEYRVSSGETNIPYLQHARREGWNAEWSLGESSSNASQHQGGVQIEMKPEHGWMFRSQGALTFEDRQYAPSNILSLDNNVDINSNGNHATNGSFVLQNSTSDLLPQDLNMNLEIGDPVDDDCQVIERPTAYLSVGSSSAQRRATGSSSSPFIGPSVCNGYMMDENEGRSDCPLDGRRVSCKRKTLEGHMGQSSGAGSSSSFPNAERNQLHTTIPAAQIAAPSIGMPIPMGNDVVMNNGSEQANPRLRLGVGGAVSTSPFSLTASTGNPGTHRNFRLRINGLQQPDPVADNLFPTESDGNADASSSRRSSRLVRNNRLFDMNPAPAVENVNLYGQSVLLPPPTVRRSHTSRWSGASSSRASSLAAPAIPEVRPSVPYIDPTSRNIPRSISEHPLFIPSGEMGTPSQNPTNWNLVGGNNSTAENVAPTPLVAPSTVAGSSAPNWSRRTCPQYPRRLSEFVRRSLLSPAGTVPGGHRGNRAVQPNPSATQEMALPPGPDYHRHRGSGSRAAALLGRHHDGTFGIPYSLRTLAAASEGRSGIMSEQIRHVLDLMRRGEGLRLEDVMILEHPIFFGMADIHDRHRDMRMDVDNMSYEELLALEERIGNVCTGLTEETIMTRLKQKKYTTNCKQEGHVETEEPCSICREEFNDGENIGVLECGHDFHTDCIKQWLMNKNLCPICKSTGLNTS